MTYLPGEKLQIISTGTVGRVLDAADRTWLEIHLDDQGGVTQSVPLNCPAVVVKRVTPAAGMPKPGELWQDREGTVLFVTKDRYGNPQFTTADGRTQSIEWRNNQFGPITPVHQLPIREQEPDWTWDDEDNPRFCTDPSGKVWDLASRYHDGKGHLWHWAGGFGRDGDDGPMRPLMSRCDWSETDVQITDLHGPLTPVDVEEPQGGDA